MVDHEHIHNGLPAHQLQAEVATKGVAEDGDGAGLMRTVFVDIRTEVNGEVIAARQVRLIDQRRANLTASSYAEQATGCAYNHPMNFAIEFDQEEDGRWIAEIPALPGVMVYGATKAEAESKVEALALRVIADKMERESSTMTDLHFAAA